MIMYPSKTAAMLGNFGVGQLNIKEAASLIAKCLFCNGDIDVEYEVEAVSLYDPKLDEVLKDTIVFYEEKLTAAVDKQTLKSSMVTRDINENIIKDTTFVECTDLYRWLEDRGIELGDLYHHDYISEICHILELVEKTVDKARIERKNPELIRRYEQDKEYDYFALHKTIEELRQELASQKTDVKEKSLSTRTRDTALIDSYQPSVNNDLEA